jgi:cytoskeletal protein RodZ
MQKKKTKRKTGILLIILVLILVALIILGRFGRQNRMRFFRIHGNNEEQKIMYVFS